MKVSKRWDTWRAALVGALLAALVGAGCSANSGAGQRDGRHQAGVASGGTSSGGGGAPLFIGTAATAGTGLLTVPGASSGGSSAASSAGGMTASTPLPTTATMAPYIVDDTPAAGLPRSSVDQLKKGGGSCSAPLLYPYADTVFPVGLPAPTLMWAGPVDAAYVRLAYDGRTDVDYQAAAGASAPGAFTLGDVQWNDVLRRGGSVLRATISTLSGGAVSTCTTTFRVAAGKMSGTVFYNTYNSPDTAGNGAILRLKLGDPQSQVYARWTGALNFIPGTGPCVSCHSVSFDGSTMVAATHDYMNKVFNVSSMPVQAAPDPAPMAQLGNGELGALTPNGARILTMGNPDCTAGADTFPRSSNNFPLIEGPDVARVRDTKTGQEVPAKGLEPSRYMWMPQFSPNGDRVVFNHAKPDGAGGTDRRELAVMDYDYATNTFSNLRVIVSKLGPAPSMPYQPASAGSGALATGVNGCTNANPASLGVGALAAGSCTGPCYPAYPFFTPDGKGVIFSLTSEPDFAGSFPGRDRPALSELWYVDLASGKAVALTNANDERAGTGAAQDQYYPTVMPVSVGGYFWVFWTSKRAWGNRTFGGALGGLPPIPGLVIPGGLGGSDAVKKRLWVAAIDIAPAPGTDPSHPGFYLVGQSDTGNIRAFAALNPCQANGTKCELGLDCCGGFCVNGSCADTPPPPPPPPGGPPPPACARENERCKTDADCCEPSAGATRLACYGGYCGTPIVR